MTRARAALAAGLATLMLVAAASALAWRERSPLVPRAGGTLQHGTAWTFLALVAVAFVAYACGLVLVRRARVSLLAVGVVAVAIQLAPLASPLLLSTDAWTYWDYARLAAVHGGDPYDDRPSTYPGDPAFAHMGAAWRRKTSVYGPAFTLVSEPLALADGRSASATAWTYKALAALAVLAATGFAARLTRRRSLAAAFVGWNPVLAIHLAGGGHNDAWVGALLVAALALGAGRRVQSAGAVWVLAIAVKWVPLVFVVLHTLAERGRRRPLGIAGSAGAAGVVAALASWRYGHDWLAALEPLADNARLETSYALPHRLQGIGVPRGVAFAVALTLLAVMLAWLARRAAAGRARLALAACVVLATTPYLAVWYLGWAVPLAGADEEDRTARVAVLALCAYLLPQTIPL